MAADIKSKYSGTSATALTITLSGLATAGARQSTIVDNATNLFLDCLLMTTIQTGSGTIGADKACYVYGYGIIDTGSPTYPSDGTALTGSDAAATMGDPTQLRLIGIIPCPAISTTYVSNPMSVAAAFGGMLPPKWGIVLVNKTNTTLGAASAASYLGILSQSV